MKPFFSIIIPTYNAAKTLAVCIDSIICQTCNSFELLIVDGGSTDNTIMIIKKYQAHQEEIKWISEKDKGIYDAMNKGIKLSKGKWVYFLGSDDRLYDNLVLENIRELIVHFSNMDVLYGNVYSTRFNGIHNGEFTNEKILNSNICHQAIFFKKNVFTKIGDFNLKYKAHADYDHNLRWFLSKEISREYTSLVIADYADGGYSSIHGDAIFMKDKRYKYLLYGKKTLDRNTKIHLFKSELRNAIIARQSKKVVTMLLNLPYILL